MDADTQFAYTAQLSPAQLRTAVGYALRKRIRIIRILGWVLVLDGLMLVTFTSSAYTFATFTILLGAVFFLGLPPLMRWTVLRLLRAGIDGPLSYRIDAEGVRTATSLTDGSLRWPVIKRLEEHADLVLLWLAGPRFIVMSVAELDAPTRAALVTFMKARIAAAAGPSGPAVTIPAGPSAGPAEPDPVSPPVAAAEPVPVTPPVVAAEAVPVSPPVAPVAAVPVSAPVAAADPISAESPDAQPFSDAQQFPDARQFKVRPHTP
jgi:hypothetical protein